MFAAVSYRVDPLMRTATKSVGAMVMVMVRVVVGVRVGGGGVQAGSEG